jgi:valyl-tRNA synthetase
LEDLIDREKESLRLKKQFDKLTKDITSLENRINSPGFKDKAPTSVFTEVSNSLFDKKKQLVAVELQMSMLIANAQPPSQ